MEDLKRKENICLKSIKLVEVVMGFDYLLKYSLPDKANYFITYFVTLDIYSPPLKFSH